MVYRQRHGYLQGESWKLATTKFQKIHQYVGRNHFRLILALTAHNKWRPKSMDIKTAFLQGQQLEKDIYVRHPNEACCPAKVWNLQKLSTV